ncbi:MAG: hypothetical protein QXS37_06530, partial [Candidatus Aenigmatarchaeota archaeon]
FCDELKQNILNIKDVQDFGLAYLLYLNLVDILYNVIEENSIKRPFSTHLAKTIGYKFIQIHELKESGRDNEVISPLIDIIKEYRQIIDQEYRIPKTEEVLSFRRKHISIELSLRDHEYYVAGYAYPIFFTLDDLLLNPQRNKMIKRAFTKEIKRSIEEEGVNKLCFIEKQFGPIGSITLLSSLVEKTNLPAVIYRPRHWNFKSKITGELANSDKICIVYDLSVTGGAIMDATNFLENNFPVKVTSAIVLYDYGFGAKEKLLKEYGVKLRPVIDLSLEKIRETLQRLYRKEWEELNSRILKNEITFEKYIEEGKALFNRFADYQLFARKS